MRTANWVVWIDELKTSKVDLVAEAVEKFGREGLELRAVYWGDATPYSPPDVLLFEFTDEAPVRYFEGLPPALERLEAICEELGVVVGKDETPKDSIVIRTFAARLYPIQRGLVELARTLPVGAVTWSIVDDARRRIQDAMVELNTEANALGRLGQ